MNLQAITGWRWFRPVMGAALAVLCGLVLWGTPLGDWWVNSSYDYQFRFGSHAVTNQIVLVQMDNESYDFYKQERFDSQKPDWQPWRRGLHARLLRKLHEGGAALVVMDTFFRSPRDSTNDQALLDALRSQTNVVIMAEQAKVENRKLFGVEPIFPAAEFLEAAHTNWGVACFDPDESDWVVRKHWPYPSPGPSTPAQFFSLPWAAASMAGAKLDNSHARERWLRYYYSGAWTSISYRHALEEEPPEFFHGKIVFIGIQPHETAPNILEEDKFRTPLSKAAVGGVEINITEFLNLMNGDWLERPPWWVESLVLALAGILLGGGLCRVVPFIALFTAGAVAVVVMLVGVSWSYYGNYWFPWLVIAGGQVPFALGWAIFMPAFYRVQDTVTGEWKKIPVELPATPGYHLFNPPFGEGAYGRVWLAKNSFGQWQALKVIYLANFENHTDPFDREFNGISRYRPVSDKHPGLLRVDFVSRKHDKYFYYVMELGDALKPGWERKPSTYRPRDLASVRARAAARRLPVRECVHIGIALSDAVEFLHQQGLTHRDIKPQNVIFVNGHPKLADMGLTAEIRRPAEQLTYVGTPGYMPPPPERPGTVQADIYSLGMVLYVLTTGRAPTLFPELATTLVQNPEPGAFFPLNTIILKACEPDSTKRYQSAAELNHALKELEKTLGPAPVVEH